MPNIPVTIKANHLVDGELQIVDRLLLSASIESNRPELVKWLVNQPGIDVNHDSIIDTYQARHNTEMFELLVNNGLLKSDKMNNYSVILEEVGNITVSKCHDIFSWKNHFSGRVNEFIDWTKGAVNLCSEVGLFSSLKSFASIFKGTSYADIPTRLEFLSEGEMSAIMSKYQPLFIQPAFLAVKAYFTENWHKSLLVCNEFSFDSHNPLSIPELKILVGQELFEYHLNKWCINYDEEHKILEVIGGISENDVNA